MEVASSTTAATYMLGGREWDAGASLAGCYAFTYASSGCARCRHSLQYTLPGAFATDLEQPSYWQRLRHARCTAACHL